MAYRWTMHRLYDAVGNDTSGPSPLSLWWLARAAAEETLQGSPLAASWLKLFRSHLSGSETYWLQWAEDLAQSAELRRAYSGLYGRFAARALLTAHFGFGRFVSLRRNGVEVPGSIKVERTKKGDIPDWVAWDDKAGRHVLCEAKGSLTANDFLSAGTPKCVTEGKAQFDRVQCTGPSGGLNPARWVAASRWATELRGGQATTLLWDPPSDHKPFPEEAARRHREAMTRAWLDSLAPGLGWRSGADLLAGEREGNAVFVRAEPGPIPHDEDWPLIGDEQAADLSGARAKSELTHKVVTRVGTTLSASDLYQTNWVSHERASEKVALEGRYISALVTPYGVRPIRVAADVDELHRAQERAQALEQPAMLVGIPLGLDPAAALTDQLWMDGAGISRSQDLAVFDLRRIVVEGGEVVAA
jgi:hypothetical protein